MHHHLEDECFQPLDLPKGVMLDLDPHCDHITSKAVICFGVEGNYVKLQIAYSQMHLYTYVLQTQTWLLKLWQLHMLSIDSVHSGFHWITILIYVLIHSC